MARYTLHVCEEQLAEIVTALGQRVVHLDEESAGLECAYDHGTLRGQKALCSVMEDRFARLHAGLNPHGERWQAMSDTALDDARQWCMVTEDHDALAREIKRRREEAPGGFNP